MAERQGKDHESRIQPSTLDLFEKHLVIVMLFEYDVYPRPYFFELQRVREDLGADAFVATDSQSSYRSLGQCVNIGPCGVEACLDRLRMFQRDLSFIGQRDARGPDIDASLPRTVLYVYTAAPGSPSDEALELLACWTHSPTPATV